MQLHKLNPFNSLFGRVFVWFWTALLVILVSAFFLVKQLTNVLEVNAASDSQLERAAAELQRLNRGLERGNSLNQSLRRLGQRNGSHFVAIKMGSNELRLGFPGPLSGNINELKAFTEGESPLLIQLNNMEFVGPYSLVYKESVYKVFVGRLLLRSERNAMSRSKVAIAGLSLAIILSTFFCFALVMSITKPIGALRIASHHLAKGDLTTRIQGLEARQDEVGNLARDFNAMAARLQNLVDSQKQLMANVSHELRTPLTRLQLAVALLEDELLAENNDAPANSKAKQLSRIESEITKMDQMIGQVLTLAKLSASQQRVNKQNVTIASLLANVLRDARFEAEAMEKRLVLSDIPDVSIYADSQLLLSALENIIRNAIRFASKTVYCQFREDITAQYVEIRITDDGTGMSASELASVFDPFFRGSHQVSEVSKGAGLGLSIAKAAIEVHEGSIQATAAALLAETSVGEPPSQRSLQQSSPLTGLSVIIHLPIITEQP